MPQEGSAPTFTRSPLFDRVNNDLRGELRTLLRGSEVRYVDLIDDERHLALLVPNNPEVEPLILEEGSALWVARVGSLEAETLCAAAGDEACMYAIAEQFLGEVCLIEDLRPYERVWARKYSE